MAERFIQGRYQLKEMIGHGSHGRVYRAIDLQTREDVAVKIAKNPQASSPHHLHEAKLYENLRGAIGIPDLKWAGNDEDDYILILEMLGPSLKYLFLKCGRRFSLKTVLALAVPMIERIQYVHSRGFLHRDIKPDNFLMGTGTFRSNQVYISDFGLSKRYIERQTNRHIPFRDGKSLVGTARYASLNAHLGFELSRRDDLEALGYVLFYFLNGGLPWQNERAATEEETYKRILEGKRYLTEFPYGCYLRTVPKYNSHLLHPLKELCRKYPIEFSRYMGYCKSLEFDQLPHYEYLKNLFKDLFRREGYCHENVTFDWKHLRRKTEAESSTHPVQQASGTVPPPAEDSDATVSAEAAGQQGTSKDDNPNDHKQPSQTVAQASNSESPKEVNSKRSKVS